MKRPLLLIPFLALTAYVLTASGLKNAAVEGIDVSRWQGSVDWSQVESGGVRFVFVKVTQGAREVDPKLKENWAALGRTKILRGGYHFLEPEVDGALQARHFLAHVKPASGELIPAVDVEKAGPRLHQVLKDYLAEMKKQTGLDAIIYASPAFWNEHIAPHLEKDLTNPFWIAEYGVRTPKVAHRIGPWAIWQYTEEGRVPGIKGKVDRDRARTLKAITVP